MKLTEEQKAARRAERKAVKEEAAKLEKVEREKNQPPVKSITITIEWGKSRTCGANPHAEADVRFKDGQFERRGGYTASGWGYDKESTVVAQIFNDFLKYKLWQFAPEQIKGGHGSMDHGPAPYGINSYSETNRSYAGGIGVNCYYDISEYIGGKFVKIAGGKTFDVYEYTDNEVK